MKPALAIALKVIRNRYFWIALALVVAGVVVYRSWERIEKLFRRDFGNYAEDPPLNSDREKELQALARATYAKIYGMPGASMELAFLPLLLELNDTDLKYMARYYERAVTRGNSLKEDIDDEFLPWTLDDEKLIARLNQLGL